MPHSQAQASKEAIASHVRYLNLSIRKSQWRIMNMLSRLKSFALKLNGFHKYFLSLLFWLLYIIRCHGIVDDFCFDENREGKRL
jgi:hypothetical protein